MKWASTLCFNVKVECSTVTLDYEMCHRLKVRQIYSKAQDISGRRGLGTRLNSAECSDGGDVD